MQMTLASLRHAGILLLSWSAWGCSSDPPVAPPFAPATGQPGAPATLPDGGSVPEGGGSDGGFAYDAADPPRDAGYRDPQPGDGGCLAPNLVCNGKCVAIGSDTANCGACGNVCMGAGAYCNAGRCACVGALVDYCGGLGCTDVSSDVNNCGACAFVCDPAQFNACSSGACDNQ